MGMDLIPMNPSPEAPRYPDDDQYSPGCVIPGRYNWTGWGFLCDCLTKWGVSLEHFDGLNDGKVIPDKKCKEVADAIENNLGSLSNEDQEFLRGDIALWRTCGGYEQW